jgi:hypothetical protein
MPALDPELQALGDALERAAAADLATGHGRARHARRRRRRLGIAAVAALIAVPGIAVAATSLVSERSVAESLPAGTRALIGTDPTCTVVREGVEYRCTLAEAPAGEIGAGRWKGTVEPTVGPDRRVNGGCRSLAADGRTWSCYLGRAAVEQRIIGAGFLGEEVSGPGVG